MLCFVCCYVVCLLRGRQPEQNAAYCADASLSACRLALSAAWVKRCLLRDRLFERLGACHLTLWVAWVKRWLPL